MFTCWEIETTGYTPRQLLELFVMEKRAETNLTQIQGIDADGDDGTWDRLKKGYEKSNDVNFSWFAKDGTLATAGTFQKVPYGTSKTIAQFATHTGITIDNQTGITDALYWTCGDILNMMSDYFFTILTPDGIALLIPTAIGSDRGTVIQSNCIIRVLSDKTINYSGESTGDIFIEDGGHVQPDTITDAYKQLAVNKANAAANYIVFNTTKIYAYGDYIKDWDGNKFVIMSGRKVDTETYAYTAVLEQAETLTFSGADVAPVISIDAEIGNLQADNIETFTDVGSEQTPINAVSLVAAADTDLIISMQDVTSTGDITGLREAWVKFSITGNSPNGISTFKLYLLPGDTSGLTGGIISQFAVFYTTNVNRTVYLRLPFGRYTIRNDSVSAPANITLTVKYKDKKSSLTY